MKPNVWNCCEYESKIFIGRIELHNKKTTRNPYSGYGVYFVDISVVRRCE